MFTPYAKEYFFAYLCITWLLLFFSYAESIRMDAGFVFIQLASALHYTYACRKVWWQSDNNNVDEMQGQLVKTHSFCYPCACTKKSVYLDYMDWL